MAIKINDISTVLGLNPKTNTQLETIILEYGNLVQKMNNMEQQSWMFKKAEKNNLLKLKDLKRQFENIRKEVNDTSIDDLIELLNDKKENTKSFQNSPQLNFIGRIAVASLNSDIIYIEELLAIKSRVDEMKELDYYLENKESLIKLLGWKPL